MRSKEFEVPAEAMAVVCQASEAAEQEDRLMAVGHHPYFGWVYRDAEDDGALSEFSGPHYTVDASGVTGVAGAVGIDLQEFDALMGRDS